VLGREDDLVVVGPDVGGRGSLIDEGGRVACLQRFGWHVADHVGAAPVPENIGLVAVPERPQH
jgi:hypothetical protein